MTARASLSSAADINSTRTPAACTPPRSIAALQRSPSLETATPRMSMTGSAPVRSRHCTATPAIDSRIPSGPPPYPAPRGDFTRRIAAAISSARSHQQHLPGVDRDPSWREEPTKLDPHRGDKDLDRGSVYQAEMDVAQRNTEPNRRHARDVALQDDASRHRRELLHAPAARRCPPRWPNRKNGSYRGKPSFSTHHSPNGV